MQSRLLRGNPSEEVKKAGIHTEAKHLKVNEVIIKGRKDGKLRSNVVSNLLEGLFNIILEGLLNLVFRTGRKAEKSDFCPYTGELYLGIHHMKLCKHCRLILFFCLSDSDWRPSKMTIRVTSSSFTAI